REFRRHINTLLEIVEKNRLTPDEASVMLEKLYMELRPFQQEAIRVINTFRMIDTVVRTLLIFTCVSALIWAAGVVVESFLAGFGMASAAVTIGTLSAQVLAFTLSSRIAECLLDERVVIFDSMSDFLKTLGTNAILFMFFHAVSAVVKPMMKSFHLSTSVRAVQYMSNSITMMITTIPVFAYQQYKRSQLSNKDEWVQFVIVQSILSAVCSGLLVSVQGRMVNVEAAVKIESRAWGVNARYRWEKIKYEVRSNAIDKEINEIYLERDKIPPIYRNDFKLNETTAKQLHDAKMSVVNRSKKMLKALKSLNRDLRLFRKNVSVNRESSMDISPENEIEAMEYLINQAESRMQSITFTPNQNRAMADFVHNTLPKYLVDNKVNGLSMLGESGSFYTCQRIFKIIQKVPRLSLLDFKGNPLRAVDVPEESVFRNLPERYREGILRIQGKWEIDGKSGVAEITVFDLNAKGVVPRDFFQKRYTPEPLKEESSQIPLTITKKGIDVYIEYSNKDPEEIIKLLCDRPEELVWSQEDLAELTQEIQEIGLEGLKARGLKKLTVMRIQEHNYGLANRPAIFVGDPFYFLGIDNPVSAKESIGYGKKSTLDYKGNHV
ncbi:MAG TPA: hypothetical protein VHO70_01425, partial [Chitinispirillaceae bacterium]|nr:hypothetical protein [Chitinispirillaceae bacterium]